MTNKAIYRPAIIDNTYNVVYVSDVYFVNKDTAVKEAKKMRLEGEEETKTDKWLNKWIDASLRIGNQYKWYWFEIIKKYTNCKYIGIIKDTLVLE